MYSDLHRVIVEPTVEREIALRCQCGWVQRFGYSPYPTQLVQGEFDHLREATGGLRGNVEIPLE